MFIRILAVLAIFIAIALLLFWIIGGGIGRTVEQAQTPPDSADKAPWWLIRLPWQPDNVGLGPDVTRLLEEYSDGGGSEAKEDLDSLQREYEQLGTDIEMAQNFGTPSPHRGAVRIYDDGTRETAPNAEYLTLSAGWNNTGPVDIAGWSLQSALSGVRAFIPRGASNFVMGTVNTQTNIQLNPGVSATVITGHSPVGTSFRENICSGYLNQLQTFTPRLQERCPLPYEAVPLTAENLTAYGEACVDFARSLPLCTAPLETIPQEYSIQCKNFLANTFSYNGCVNMYRHRSNFLQDSWRVYLSASRELWRNTHDVIRLLDAEGKTVDALTY